MRGRLLKAWRLRRGIKQAHLAELLRVGQPTVSRWEAGLQVPSAAQAAAIDRLCAARLHPTDDAYLKRLVEASLLPVHLICDASHRLLAASPAREVEWRRSRRELLGVPLLRFAPEDIARAERGLGAVGWFDRAAPRAVLATAGRVGGRFHVAPGLMLWERLQLGDGGFARLVTSIAEPEIDAIRLN